MEIPTTTYDISPANWTKPTPPWIKWTADVLLFLSACVAILPDFQGREWVMAAGSIAKLLSNFITEHTPNAT